MKQTVFLEATGCCFKTELKPHPLLLLDIWYPLVIISTLQIIIYFFKCNCKYSLKQLKPYCSIMTTYVYQHTVDASFLTGKVWKLVYYIYSLCIHSVLIIALLYGLQCNICGYYCVKDPIKNLLYRKHPVTHTSYIPYTPQTDR